MAFLSDTRFLQISPVSQLVQAVADDPLIMQGIRQQTGRQGQQIQNGDADRRQESGRRQRRGRLPPNMFSGAK